MKRLILSRINPMQKKRIENLYSACREAEPIRLSFPLPETGEEMDGERFFLLYEGGELVSLIDLFYPDGQTGELIGFTRPGFRHHHFFSRLLSLAAGYAKCIGLNQVYLVSDGESQDADAAIASLGLREEYAEYLLKKNIQNGCLCQSENEELAIDGPSRLPLDPMLFAAIFPEEKDQCDAYLKDISVDDHSFTCFFRRCGQTIGQAQVTLLNDMAYLSGFGILPEYRGRGYGRLFLCGLEVLLSQQSFSSLTLQVSSKNKTALSLYRKDGFRELEALRYYPLF